jgi:RNA polymerase sigma factor (sigma-70 family)
MLDQLQRQELALACKTGNDTMEGNGSDPHQDKARRFRDAALPYLDDVYTLARYLLRDTGDAEDAVQECYLRALRHFDTFRGPAIKPWLFAILRNVCRGEFARRSSGLHYIDQYVGGETDKDEDAVRILELSFEISPFRRHCQDQRGIGPPLPRAERFQPAAVRSGETWWPAGGMPTGIYLR